MNKRAKNNMCFVSIFLTSALFACDACQLQQPKITQNFTHGTGPQSDWDWFIVVIVILNYIMDFYSIPKIFI